VDYFKFCNKISVEVAVEALRDYRRLRKGTVDELWREADQQPTPSDFAAYSGPSRVRISLIARLNQESVYVPPP
jgi:hypothetical protein